VAADKPLVTLADITRLQDQENKPTPLTADEVDDYATAVLVILRGLTVADKRKVLARATALTQRRRR